MTTPALSISDLDLHVEHKQVLNHFTLNIASGERVLITAPSGTGKSSLLRCILGFLPPQRGSIHLYGEPVTSDSIWSLRRHMSYVAQEPVLGEGLVRDALSRPFTYRINRPHRDRLRRVPELLAQLGLPEQIATQRLATLSGGEKQRIALVAALLLERPLLLLDEISASLDRASADAVHTTLAALPQQTILAVGHHENALPDADRVQSLEPYTRNDSSSS